MPEGAPKALLRSAVSKLHEATITAERAFDRFRFTTKARLGWIGPLTVLPYRSYGTRERLRVVGRVTEERAVEKATEKDSSWKNLVRMVHRLESDEIPGAKLHLRRGDHGVLATTDHEGYFSAELAVASEGGWQHIEVRVLEALGKPPPEPVAARAEVLVPGDDADYGVITDIDDTVLRTHVTEWAKMLKVTPLGNAQTRLSLEGCPELYRVLSRGTADHRTSKSDAPARHPIFYVSKSPWNMYDLLVDFMDRHDLPRGPLLLRDLGLDQHFFGQQSLDQRFKFEQVRKLLATYPHSKFFLIGDSGERDPDIYGEVVRRFPSRVLAVYIRDVSVGVHTRSDRRVQEIAERCARHGVEMRLIEHSEQILEHAVAHGWVRRSRGTSVP